MERDGVEEEVRQREGGNRRGQKETGREGRENNRREETGEMHLCNVE